MTASDKAVLLRLAGGRSRAGASVDDLQGLLLQITLAIMVIFIIAFFIFREKATRDAQSAEQARQEEVLKLNLQKLTLAADRVEQERRARYGLGVKAADVVQGGALTAAPTVREAFVSGAKSARADFADASKLAAEWRAGVLAAAELGADALGEDERAWLAKRVEKDVASVRADVVLLQRNCATAFQIAWLANPKSIGDPELAGLVGRLKGADDQTRLMLATEISAALKERSLKRLEELTGAEVLP